MSNKKQENELLEFLGGLAMLVVGLYWFSTNVSVTSSFFSGFALGGVNVNSGMVIVPFIIAIVLCFINSDSFGCKVFLGLSVLLIIASVVASTKIYLRTMSLFEWAGVLVLIFGGAGLLAKILFKPVKNKNNDNNNNNNNNNNYYRY